MSWRDRLRGRRRTSQLEAESALYVHLALDGGILVIRGATGEQLWVDRDGLHRELALTKEQGGSLLYSREAGDREPPAHVEDTFRVILGYELPIMLLEESPPEALVPPSERRSITRDR